MLGSRGRQNERQGKSVGGEKQKEMGGGALTTFSVSQSLGHNFISFHSISFLLFLDAKRHVPIIIYN